MCEQAQYSWEQLNRHLHCSQALNSLLSPLQCRDEQMRIKIAAECLSALFLWYAIQILTER